MVNTLPKRSEIPLEETWNAESVYTNADDWQRDYRVVDKHIQKLADFEGKLSSSPDLLLDFLTYLDSLRSDVDRLKIYATMSYSVDATDEAATTRYNQFIDLNGRLNEVTAFIKPELLAISPETLTTWLEQPQLADYRHYFDELERSRTHTRSAAVEALLGGLSSLFMGAPVTNSTLANGELKFGKATDSQGQKQPISQSTIRGLLSSPDRKLRRSAYEQYADAHLAVKKTLGSLLSTGVKQTVFVARHKNYASSLAMALGDKNIPLEVFPP